MITIFEAAMLVMNACGEPMTASEVYHSICAAGLYKFNSDDAEHIVRTQIRRYCVGLNFAGASSRKLFGRTSDGRYFPLTWVRSDPAQESGNGARRKGQERVARASTVVRTSAKRVIDARLGQGWYRTELECAWDGKCAVTGCSVGVALRASHIKSWAESSDAERLDNNNGLLLIATLDALFDRFLISFSDTGVMLVSSSLPRDQFGLLGLGGALRKPLNVEQRNYLSYHRGQFMEKEAVLQY